MAAGLDPERCILFRQGDVEEHTELAWLLSERHGGRRAQPHAPVPRQVGRAARAGVRRTAVLPGADGRRRARLPRPRGAGRGGPARARGADARHRRALQQPLRRATGGARGPHPRGRRARPRPPRARAQDVDHRHFRAGHRLRARRAGRDPAQVPARGRRLRARDRPPRGQAGDLEPDRDHGRRSRDGTGGDRARVRRLRLRRLQDRGGGRGGRLAGPGALAVRGAARRSERARADRSRTGADKARAIASGTLADVREAMGVGPPRRSVPPGA